jgi:hypothetical protein
MVALNQKYWLTVVFDWRRSRGEAFFAKFDQVRRSDLIYRWNLRSSEKSTKNGAFVNHRVVWRREKTRKYVSETVSNDRFEALGSENRLRLDSITKTTVIRVCKYARCRNYLGVADDLVSTGSCVRSSSPQMLLMGLECIVLVRQNWECVLMGIA